MNSLIFLVLFCSYMLVSNYFFKKKFKIGFWTAWSECDSKRRYLEVLMPFVVVINAFLLTVLTYLMVTTPG